MKKTLVLVAVALMAIPAFAGVTITLSDEGGGVCAVNYSDTGTAGTRVRAFALNLALDNDANVLDVNAMDAGGINFLSKYFIFPGTITINGNAVTRYGTPVAVQDQLPGDTRHGLGIGTGASDYGFTCEVASLYKGEPNAPAASGTLFKFKVDKSTNVTVSLNVSRGGIVREDLGAVTLDSPLPVSYPVVVPPALCLGDIDGDTWISSYDYYALVEMLTPYAADDYAYPVDPNNPADLAADIDQDQWVSSYDYYALVEMLTPYADQDYAYPCP